MPRKKAKALPPTMVSICGDILQETEDAILVDCDGEEVWLPKSQIEYDGERGDEAVDIELPEWLAEEKGLANGQGMAKYATSAPSPQEPEQPPATVDMDTTVLDISEKDGVHYITVQADTLDMLTYTLPADAVTTSDGAGPLKPGETRLLHIARDAAIAAGIIDPPQSGKAKPLPQALVGRDVHWFKHDTFEKAFPLSDADKLFLGEKMAAAQARIDKLEDELADIRKSYKARIDVERETLSEAAKEFNGGETEPQQVKCDVFQDFTSGELVWVSADESAEILNRRPMTAEERRPTLFDAAPVSTQAEQEAAEPDAVDVANGCDCPDLPAAAGTGDASAPAPDTPQ